MDRELLLQYGIDYDRGMKNCMDNLAFYKKILDMFLQDACFSEAKKAFAAGDMQELFNRMHELKGISGNTALVALYQSTVPLVELLRTQDASKDDASVLFHAVETAYLRTCDGVKQVLNTP